MLSSSLSITELKPYLIQVFPQYFPTSEDLLEIIPLKGDASSRSYYRLIDTHRRTFVLMISPTNWVNESFIELTGYFNACSIQVPTIYAFHEGLGMMLLEDLGDNRLFEKAESLLAVSTEPEGRYPSLESLYRLAIDAIFHLQKAPWRSGLKNPVEDLYFDVHRWAYELHLTHAYMILGLFALPVSPTLEMKLFSFYHDLAKEVDTNERTPATLVHRDYHSKNLMEHRQKLWMIDYQDTRMGNPFYDIASLLFDSYLDIPNTIRTSSIKYFIDGFEEFQSEIFKQAPVHDIERKIRYAALQRNIKACGTFAWMQVVRKNPSYLKYLVPTLRHIISHFEWLNGARWSVAAHFFEEILDVALQQENHF